MIKALAGLGLLLLTACGVDGEPIPPSDIAIAAPSKAN